MVSEIEILPINMTLAIHNSLYGLILKHDLPANTEIVSLMISVFSKLITIKYSSVVAI